MTDDTHRQDALTVRRTLRVLAPAPPNWTPGRDAGRPAVTGTAKPQSGERTVTYLCGACNRPAADRFRLDERLPVIVQSITCLHCGALLAAP